MKTTLHPRPYEAGGWRLFPLLAWIVLGLSWLAPSPDLAAQPTITQHVVSNNTDFGQSATATLDVDGTFVKITGQPIVEDWEPTQVGSWCDYQGFGI